MGRRLSALEIEALPPEKRRETLKKRKQRAGKAVAPVLVLPPPPPRIESTASPAEAPRAPPPPPGALVPVIPGIDPEDRRAVELFSGLRDRLQKAGRWRGEATAGLLLSYVKATRAIESWSYQLLDSSTKTAQLKLHAALGLDTLPPEKSGAVADRFGGTW